jgi:murein DD-endopeptidase MepM/ murein hydrolase activator NlpD
MQKLTRLFLWTAVFALILLGLIAWLWLGRGPGSSNTTNRDRRVLEWLNQPEQHPEWAVKGGQRCGDAPFILPTDGYIGYLWDDSFRPGHHHQGLDIFGGTEAGSTPVVAAADGYLTRQADWKSSLIIRLPNDPLLPERQIWTYYTHMADPQGNSLIAAGFPPGSAEVFVAAGTLLGYQGNFSGTPGVPVGVHLHFSIVKDDGAGGYLNELQIENTLDPSPYLGIPLNVHQSPLDIPLCPSGADPSGES